MALNNPHTLIMNNLAQMSSSTANRTGAGKGHCGTFETPDTVAFVCFLSILPVADVWDFSVAHLDGLGLTPQQLSRWLGSALSIYLLHITNPNSDPDSTALSLFSLLLSNTKTSSNPDPDPNPGPNPDPNSILRSTLKFCSNQLQP